MKRQSKTCITLIKLRDGRLMMGGDRKVSESYSRSYQCPFPKIRKKDNGMLVGASGDSALCKFVVDVWQPPDVDTNDLDFFMFHRLLKSLHLALCNLGYKDDHNTLKLPSGTECGVLIGYEDRGFIIDISSGDDPDSPSGHANSTIAIDDVPIPFVIGCGSGAAFPILHSTKTKSNTNTKADVLKAMITAAELSPGCDDKLDFITTDL